MLFRWIFFRHLRGYLADVSQGIGSLIKPVWNILPYVFSANDMRKEVTEQYPDPVSSRTEDDLPARSRGLLHNQIDQCTGCGDCVSVCPVKCIRLNVEEGPSQDKKWVSVFDIDFGSCVFCGLCVETCRPSSLTHTKKFEIASFIVSDLVTSFGRGSVSPELREKWRVIRESETLDL